MAKRTIEEELTLTVGQQTAIIQLLISIIVSMDRETIISIINDLELFVQKNEILLEGMPLPSIQKGNVIHQEGLNNVLSVLKQKIVVL